MGVQTAATIRREVEQTLSGRIPGALSPRQRFVVERCGTGVAEVDALLGGGLPVGAISELIGPSCSGRTAIALSFLANRTRGESPVAWIDVSDRLDPESAAAAGIDLARLLWVRCADPETRQAKAATRKTMRSPAVRQKVWSVLDQALRAADLLLQACGFEALVLDMGDIPAECVWRIPLATWFRFRAAAERSRTSVLLLTQHPCARSSAELLVRLRPREIEAASTILTGMHSTATVERQRFEATECQPDRVIRIRKPPQSERSPVVRSAMWKRSAPWTHTAEDAEVRYISEAS